MNRNLMIVLAGGVLVAVLVALLVQASLSGSKKEVVAVKEEPRVQIAVASRDLSMGAELSDSNMKWQDWPENAVFPGAIVKKDNKKPADMVGGRLRRNIADGEPIVESALVPASKGNFVAATLGEGMRAIAVDVNAAKAAGGFIGPGDFVDIILTYKEKIKYDGPSNPMIDDMIELNIDKLATETILQNIRVLAVDQATKRDDEKIKVGKTVTLEVDLRGVETLALAGEMGELSLALRRLGDKKIYEKTGPVLTDKRLTNITDEVYMEMGKMQKTTGQMANIVRVYNGNVMEKVSVSP